MEPHVCDERNQPKVIQQEPQEMKTTETWAAVLMFLFLVRFLSQCTEYFDLRCQLLDDLTSKLINCLTHYQYLDTKILNIVFCLVFYVCISLRDGGDKREPSQHAGGWDFLAGQLWAQLELWDGDQRSRQCPVGRTPPPHQDPAITLRQWEGTSWWDHL